MERLFWALGLVFLALTNFSSVARADDAEDCSSANPDISISGCTSIIEAGAETQSYLAKARNLRGVAYFKNGHDDRALVDFGWAIDHDPKLTEAYYDRGLVLKYLRKFDEAERDFKTVLKLDPGNVRAKNSLAEMAKHRAKKSSTAD